MTIARSLIANNDLVEIFAQGKDVPDRPCTYCNRCLFGLMDSPLACYDLSRYDGDYERMMREAMSVFEPTVSNDGHGKTRTIDEHLRVQRNVKPAGALARQRVILLVWDHAARERHAVGEVVHAGDLDNDSLVQTSS